MNRAALFCPGRGAYTKKALRSLDADHPLVQRAEQLRAQRGLPSLVELDSMKTFDEALHLAPHNVSLLIHMTALVDAERARRSYEIVCVAGNSLGWYTALAVSGALSFEDGFNLVQEIGLQQREHEHGGQIVYQVADEDWQRDPDAEAAVERALQTSDGEAFDSIDLGGHRVLAGSEKGIAHLMESLPRIEAGAGFFPYRLKKHGAYHTPLLQEVAQRVRQNLPSLEFRAPELTLIDGRGARFTPWSTDPEELRTYTMKTQFVTPFRFAESVRVALREYAPDHVVLPGPGKTLVNMVGRIVAMEGWRGITSREDFENDLRTDEPFVVSLRR